MKSSRKLELMFFAAVLALVVPSELLMFGIKDTSLAVAVATVFGTLIGAVCVAFSVASERANASSASVKRAIELSDKMQELPRESSKIGAAVEGAMNLDNDWEARLAFAYNLGHSDARYAAAHKVLDLKIEELEAGS